MTFWWSNDNYGQLLQSYALSQHLTKLGHTVELIDYGFLGHPIMHLGENLVKALAGSIRYEQRYPRYFNRFREERLHFTKKKYLSVKELKDNPPKADALICGSDQVWHYRDLHIGWIIKRYTDAYMLNFGADDCHRIAYAASLGVTKFKPNEHDMISRKLSRFTRIGTREKGSVSMVSGICSVPVQWVPDPTMLLNTSDYDELSKGCQLPVPDYFVYSLGNRSVLKGKDVVSILKEAKASYLYTTCQYENDYDANVAPTIEEWLFLMKNAGTIITNSFHGMVFAILYRKDFFYYPLLTEIKGSDTRITSLLELLEIKDRVLIDLQAVRQIVDNPRPVIDWVKVSKKLEEFRKVGSSFLEQALE